MSVDSIHPSSEDLFAYRDGELPAERRVLIEAHVTSCHICRGLIDRVSELEAGLSQRPEQVDSEYYERLSRKVLNRIGAGAEGAGVVTPAKGRAAREPSEGRAAREPSEGQAAREPSEGQAAREPSESPQEQSSAPREGRLSRAPRFPWAPLVSTVAAAAAVVVVVSILFQQGALRLPGRERVALRGPAPAESVSGAPAAGEEPSTEGAPPARVPSAAVPPAAAPPTAAPSAQAPSPPAPSADGLADAGRIAAGERKGEQELMAKARDQAAGTEQLAAPAAPSPAAQEIGQMKSAPRPAARALPPAQAAPPAAGQSPYQALLLRHGLPPVWEEGRVTPRALLAAERDLRFLYQGGRAGADSASVRLYLAEAARLAYAASPDSALYDRIVHHYWRAIRLSGPESEIGRIARERLQSFSR